jgi:hypothetical protein
MKCAGNMASMRARRDVYGGLVGKPERKKPIGRPSCRWEDYIKMTLQEIK